MAMGYCGGACATAAIKPIGRVRTATRQPFNGAATLCRSALVLVLLVCPTTVNARSGGQGLLWATAVKERTATFSHGTLLTTRSLQESRRRLKSSQRTQTSATQRSVWVLGLSTHLQQQVHAALDVQGGQLLHALPGKLLQDHHWLIAATTDDLQSMLDAHEDLTAALMPPEFKASSSVQDLINTLRQDRGRRKLSGSSTSDVPLLALVPSSTASQLAQIQRACHQEMPALLSDLGTCSYRVQTSRDSIQLTVCAQGLEVAAAWLTELECVTWVDVQHRMVPMNLHASASLQAPNRMNSTPPSADVFKGLASHFFPYWEKGITGKGQVVGQVDTGVDLDSCFLWDPKFTGYNSSRTCNSTRTLPMSVVLPTNAQEAGSRMYGPVSAPQNITVFADPNHRKVVQYVFWSDGYDQTGHGTHTATTIAGAAFGHNSTAAPMLGTGIAPDAKLAVFDVFGGGPFIDVYTYQDPGQIYEVQRQAGARITSNSYSAPTTEYGPVCYLMDGYMWAVQDTLHVFSAGNVRKEEMMNSGTVTAPALCKNTLAVAAAESWVYLGSEQGAPYNTLSSTYQPLFVNTSLFMGPAKTTSLANHTGGVLKFLLSDGELLFTTDSSPGIFTPSPGFSLGMAAYKGMSIQLVLSKPAADCAAPVSLSARPEQPFVTLTQQGGGSSSQKAGCFGYGNTVSLHQHSPAAALMIAASDSAPSVPAMTELPTAVLDQQLGEVLHAYLVEGQPVFVQWVPFSNLPYDNVAWFSASASNGSSVDTVDASSDGSAALTSGDQGIPRIKPEITAPGYIMSAYGDGKYSAAMDQCALIERHGTSMATPVVAGAAALVRQYFTDGFYPQGRANASHTHAPSGPLLKAMLVAGTAAMRGISAADGQPLEPPPSRYQGFGRVDLSATLPLEGDEKGWRLQVIDNGLFLADGVMHNFTVQTDTGKPLIATLAWHDYPAFPGNLWVLVNNLDLVIEGPSPNVNETQKVWWGNDFEGGDYSNNVEKIYIPNPVSGATYTISVRASYLFWGARPQPYSLVVLGGFRGTLDSPHNPAQAVVAPPNATVPST